MAFSVFLSFSVWDYFLKTAGLLQRDEVISVQSDFLRNEEQIYKFFRGQETCIVDVFAQSLSGLRHFTELNCRMRITHLITVKENLFVKSSWSRTFLYCINMVITVCNGRVPVKTNAMQWTVYIKTKTESRWRRNIVDTCLSLLKFHIGKNKL